MVTAVGGVTSTGTACRAEGRGGFSPCERALAEMPAREMFPKKDVFAEEESGMFSTPKGLTIHGSGPLQSWAPPTPLDFNES